MAGSSDFFRGPAGRRRQVTDQAPIASGDLSDALSNALAEIRAQPNPTLNGHCPQTRRHRSRTYDSRVSITRLRLRLSMLAAAAGFLTVALTIRAAAAAIRDRRRWGPH
jgi:hypothetical protein